MSVRCGSPAASAPEHTVFVGVVLLEHFGGEVDAFRLQLCKQPEVVQKAHQLIDVDSAAVIQVVLVKLVAYLLLALFGDLDRLRVALRREGTLVKARSSAGQASVPLSP